MKPDCAETKSVKACLVREWAGLGTVADAIQRGWLNMPDKTPNKKVVLQLAREIANGMEYIHSQDIIHGCLDATRYISSSAHSAQCCQYLLLMPCERWAALPGEDDLSLGDTIS